jgi:hypothetical protein
MPFIDPGRMHWISATSCVASPFTDVVEQLASTAAETGSVSVNALET